MFQEWRDFLFLHGEVEVETIQRTLPSGLQGNTFEGKAYLGLSAFSCAMSIFAFCRVCQASRIFRSYTFGPASMIASNVPGIWFYGLDANQ
jgi:uncharacterized protein YqjF (DUF2071 family)